MTKDVDKAGCLLCGLTFEQRQPDHGLWHGCGPRGPRTGTGCGAESEGQAEAGEEEETNGNLAGPWAHGTVESVLLFGIQQMPHASCTQSHTLVLFPSHFLSGGPHVDSMNLVMTTTLGAHGSLKQQEESW